MNSLPPANLAGKHFALFLSWDARAVPGETIFTFAQKLIRAGLSYIVAWGPDCEREIERIGRLPPLMRVGNRGTLAAEAI